MVRQKQLSAAVKVIRCPVALLCTYCYILHKSATCGINIFKNIHSLDVKYCFVNMVNILEALNLIERYILKIQWFSWT